MRTNFIGWYDKTGKPLREYDEIESLLRNMDYKRIARTEVGPYYVSTVWLGLDHDFTHTVDKVNPRPVIFETMVFENELSHNEGSKEFNIKPYDYHKDLGDYTRRYCTLAEASQGHAEVVKEINDTLK